MYQNKNGNISYTKRNLGLRTGIVDKIIFGWLFMCIYLFLAVAPIYIYSDAGPFTATNPVKAVDFRVSFII